MIENLENVEGEKLIKPRMIPKPVWFILFYGLCERYCIYGTTAILALFLNTKIGFDQSTSTALYHYFFFASYAFAIVGAIIGDTFWGRFKTLVIGKTLLSAISYLILAVATVEPWSFLLNPLTAIGLVLLSFSWGCMEPNLPAYAGDQYTLPFEEKGFSFCFGLLFVIQGVGRIIGAITSPIIRTNIQCFGGTDCYPFLFGIFICVKVIAVSALFFGKRSAHLLKPKGNMFLKFCSCIGHAIKMKFFKKNQPKKDHWLDYSIEKYGTRMVADVRRILGLLYLFPSGFIVSTLFFQQASSWVFQARLMNGEIGNVTLKPDQIPAINAASLFIFVFLCEFIFVPLLKKIGIDNHLKLLALGGIIAATSFVVAAIIQFQLEHREIHMLWQIPQHMLLAFGDVLVYVQATQFFYTQAPVQMRSVMQAAFTIIMGVGNLIVALISTSGVFKNMAYEFIFYAVIVYLAMIIFIFLSRSYVYVDPQNEDYDYELDVKSEDREKCDEKIE